MSLKSTLNEIIRAKRGEIFTLKEMDELCKKYPAKLSNAERRLRESKDIEKVWNERKTAIIGYRWIESNWWDEPKYKHGQERKKGTEQANPRDIIDPRQMLLTLR